MKRAILMGVLAALLCAVAVEGQTASNQYQHIAWKWIAPATSLPTCSAAVTQACVKDYVLTLTDPSSVAQTPITVAWPNTAYTYGPGGFLFCGTWKASMVTGVHRRHGHGEVELSGGDRNGSGTVPFRRPGKPKHAGRYASTLVAWVSWVN
jgi:hypothetical protein